MMRGDGGISSFVIAGSAVLVRRRMRRLVVAGVQSTCPPRGNELNHGEPFAPVVVFREPRHERRGDD
eukprot:9175120-Pyramimonas_sp.AAC.1